MWLKFKVSMPNFTYSVLWDTQAEYLQQPKLLPNSEYKTLCLILLRQRWRRRRQSSQLTTKLPIRQGLGIQAPPEWKINPREATYQVHLLLDEFTVKGMPKSRCSIFLPLHNLWLCYSAIVQMNLIGQSTALLNLISQNPVHPEKYCLTLNSHT